MRKKWTRETVFEESKKYSSRSGFKKNSSGAFSVAYENGWLPEMPWLKTPIRNKPTKWTREAVFEESKNIQQLLILTLRMRRLMLLLKEMAG